MRTQIDISTYGIDGKLNENKIAELTVDTDMNTDKTWATACNNQPLRVLGGW